MVSKRKYFLKNLGNCPNLKNPNSQATTILSNKINSDGIEL